MRFEVLLIPLLFAAVSAELVSLAFGNHMVLQRAPSQANIWGWTEKKGNVQVVFNGQTLSSSADSTGYWKLSLPPIRAGGPYEITVKSTQESATLKDVMFGDVFFCSGQSNMELNVKYALNATAEINAATAYTNVRILKAARYFKTSPQAHAVAPRTPWTSPKPSEISDFSAVCWFFGRDLYNSIKVPIGLIDSSYGGTRIQTWSPKSAYDKCDDPYPTGGDNPDETDRNDPTVLFNGQVNPFVNFQLKSILWYQGESNVQHPAYYKCAIKAMIKGWREAFKNPSLYFYYVQLSPWSSSFDLPAQRISQNAALSLPNIGFATAMDLGDIKSDHTPIHSRKKQEVGRRLSLAVQGSQYGLTSAWLGPNITKVTKSHQGNATIVQFSFSKVSIGSGLTVKAQMKCPVSPNMKFCGTPAELQTSDGNWRKASYRLEGNSFIFSIYTSMKVIGARYLWADWPKAVLFNSANLPLPPFLVTIQ